MIALVFIAGGVRLASIDVFLCAIVGAPVVGLVVGRGLGRRIRGWVVLGGIAGAFVGVLPVFLSIIKYVEPQRLWDPESLLAVAAWSMVLGALVGLGWDVVARLISLHDAAQKTLRDKVESLEGRA
jgi:hypothetical protein